MTSCVRTYAGYCVRTQDMGPEVSICGHDVILMGSDVMGCTYARTYVKGIKDDVFVE
jgi:hypothetical protein